MSTVAINVRSLELFFFSLFLFFAQGATLQVTSSINGRVSERGGVVGDGRG